MAKTVKRTPRAILRADSDGMTLRKLTARVMSQADNQSSYRSTRNSRPSS